MYMVDALRVGFIMVSNWFVNLLPPENVFK